MSNLDCAEFSILSRTDEATWDDMSCHDNSDTGDDKRRLWKKTKIITERWQGGHRGASYMRREDTTWERECRQGKPIISPHLLCNHIYSYHPSILAKICFCLFVWHSRAPLYTPLQYTWWHDMQVHTDRGRRNHTMLSLLLASLRDSEERQRRAFSDSSTGLIRYTLIENLQHRTLYRTV